MIKETRLKRLGRYNVLKDFLRKEKDIRYTEIKIATEFVYGIKKVSYKYVQSYTKLESLSTISTLVLKVRIMVIPRRGKTKKKCE